MRSSARTARPHDPTVYPVEEKVGEDILQRWIIELLRPLLERWLGERGIERAAEEAALARIGELEAKLARRTTPRRRG